MKRATVMGIGLFGGGAGAIRWLAAQGFRVCATDLRDAGALAPTLESLADVDGVEYVLGGHRDQDFVETDLLVVNPAVPPDSRFVRIARAAGVPLATEMNLFLEHCRGDVLAITGSNGKTTTAHMTGALLGRTSRPVVLAGNMGTSILPQVDRLTDDHVVVLEISSFQLEWVEVAARPFAAAAILNVTPNHLDRHGDFEAYRAAKLRAASAVADGGTIVVPEHEAALAARIREHVGSSVPVESAPSASTPLRHLVGGHHASNLGVATELARLASPEVSGEVVDHVARTFRGLAHRTELVEKIAGVAWIDDSKATTPEATLAALRSWPAERVILILGGYDKKLPVDDLVAAAARCRRVECVGMTGPRLTHSVLAAGGVARRHEDLAAAVAAAARNARPGDVVLLSPAHASYGDYPNYVARGEAFRRFVRESAHPGRSADFS